MAAGFLIASGATKAVGAVKGKKAANKAADSQYALDQENIRLQKIEREESISRTLDTQGQQEGTIENQIGASGFSVGSSLDKYLDSTKENNASDIDWMRTSGASQDAIASREASARKRNSDAEAKGNLISGIGSALGTFGAAKSSFDKVGWGIGGKSKPAVAKPFGDAKK